MSNSNDEMIRVLRSMRSALDELEVAKGVKNCAIVAALANDMNSLIAFVEKGVVTNGDKHAKLEPHVAE